MQFARGIAESTDDENQCDLGPGNVFFSSRDGAFEELVELQFADQLERKPRSAELELIFDTNIRRVDLNPLGLETAFLIEELQLRSSRLLRAFRRSLDADPFGLLELAEPSNRPLSRATLGSIRLDQRPIRLTFPLDLAVARPDEHVGIIGSETASSNADLSTTSRSAFFAPK